MKEWLSQECLGAHIRQTLCGSDRGGGAWPSRRIFRRPCTPVLARRSVEHPIGRQVPLESRRAPNGSLRYVLSTSCADHVHDRPPRLAVTAHSSGPVAGDLETSDIHAAEDVAVLQQLVTRTQVNFIISGRSHVSMLGLLYVSVCGSQSYRRTTWRLENRDESRLAQ